MKYHQIIYIVTVQVNEAKYPVLGFSGAGAVRRGSLSLSPEVAAALRRVAGRRTDGETDRAGSPSKTKVPQGRSRQGRHSGGPARAGALLPGAHTAGAHRGTGEGPGPRRPSRPRTLGPTGAPGGRRGPCGSLRHRGRRRAGGRPGGRGGTAAPAPCVAEPPLRSAPLGSAGAGGVAVCREDFVGDPAALPLVRPLLGPQV